MSTAHYILHIPRIIWGIWYIYHSSARGYSLFSRWFTTRLSYRFQTWWMVEWYAMSLWSKSMSMGTRASNTPGMVCIAHTSSQSVTMEYYHKAKPLTHWGRDEMAAIFQTTFSNAFSWMKMFEFRLRFHWILFPGVQLTIFKHWFW